MTQLSLPIIKRLRTSLIGHTFNMTVCGVCVLNLTEVFKTDSHGAVIAPVYQNAFQIFISSIYLLLYTIAINSVDPEVRNILCHNDEEACTDNTNRGISTLKRCFCMCSHWASFSMSVLKYGRLDATMLVGNKTSWQVLYANGRIQVS